GTPGRTPGFGDQIRRGIEGDPMPGGALAVHCVEASAGILDAGAKSTVLIGKSEIVIDDCLTEEGCAGRCRYFPEGDAGDLQQSSICPAEANGQSSFRQQSVVFASANTKFTQSPVFIRRIANPSIAVTSFSSFISV